MPRAVDKGIVIRAKRSPAPRCPSFEEEASVVRFEREVRSQRASTEEFRITPGNLPGSFFVSGASGGTYAVDVVDQTREHDACSCPDFLFGRLGACKHVAAVHRAAKESVRVRRWLASLPKRAGEIDGCVVTASSGGVEGAGRLRLVALGREAARITQVNAIARPQLGAASPGELVATAEALEHARDFGMARVTQAAIAAARILEQRRERAERAWSVGEAIESRRLGVDVLAEPLFPYQRDGVAHLVRAGRAVLADDMGLGKTVQTIAACEVLRRRGEAKRILIVCPASLKAQWAGEIARYAGAQAVVVVGGVEARRAAFASDAPYVILNYELTWRDLTLLKNLEADVLVLDEAQRAKNFRTKTAATLRSIPSRFLFVLTGTPVENRLDDLYGILQLVDAEILGPLWKFNLDFHVQDPETGKILGYKSLSALRQRVAPVVLRRRKEEVLSQLPALTEQTRYVALSSEQMELEASYRRHAAMLIQMSIKRPLSPADQKRLQAYLLKARQACNAAVLCDPKSEDRVPKLDELAALVAEIAQQGTSKVLVFSEWTEMLRLAAGRLDDIGVGHLTLHGGIPSDARPALIDQFKNDDDKLVLLSTDAGGVGLNLQVASYVVHLDLPWNPARLDQRIARAHRLGQTRGVSVTYLCAETGIERGIEGTLTGKRAVRSAATDGTSDIDALEAPSFTMFLAEARQVLGGDTDAIRGAGANVVQEQPPSSSTRAKAERGTSNVVGPAPLPRTAPRREREKDLRATEAFALQRLRLAHVVLAAGFPGDAVRAAYEALAASLRARLDEPVGEEHSALVASLYRDLFPSGSIPSTLPAVLAKVHDLAQLADQGVPVDQDVAAEVVEEARTWLEREDTFSGRR